MSNSSHPDIMEISPYLYLCVGRQLDTRMDSEHFWVAFFLDKNIYLLNGSCSFMLAYKVSSGGVAGFLLSILSNYFNQEPACTTIRNCLGEL